MRKEKRIPTILGLLLLVASTFAGIQLTSKAKIFNTKASGECRPENVQATNISDQSASISFQTSDQCVANIKINGSLLSDYREQVLNQTAPIKTKIHYFQAASLKESTLYQFEIISGGTSYVNADSRLKTAAKPSSAIPASNLAWGKVFDAQKLPASGAVLFLNIPGASPLSALITSSGNWNISFASSFNQALTNWFSLPENTDEEIVVISEVVPSTVIQANTSRNNPVPDIILGQNYFSDGSVSDIGSSRSSGYLPQSSPVVSQKGLSISYPQEGEQVTSLKPQILGTGPQNSSVTIKLSNFSQSWEVMPDSTGSWQWTPPQGLLPGSNTVTISTTTGSQAVRSFMVNTGTGLAFEASSSATPTFPPPTPTTAVLPTVTVPVATIVPTRIPPTIAPTRPPRHTRPSTESGVPTTGIGSITILLGVVAVLLIIISLQLFKKSDNFN